MQYIIPEAWEGQLLRSFLQGELHLSHRLLTRLKQTEGGMTLGGVPVTVRAILHGGDMLTLAIEDTPSLNILPSDLDLCVLYEDDSILVCNKSGDMPTHPSHGHYDDTLANAVAAYDVRRALPVRPFRPINRLDRETSGIVLVARHALSAARLSKAMHERRIQKEYLAVLEGRLPTERGDITAPIRRAAKSIILRQVCNEGEEGAQRAHTEYRVLATWDDPNAPQGVRSLVQAVPHTGRTHQLRVHFAHMGAPIAGDGLYGLCDCTCTPPRQMLHAATLTFPHPDTEKSLTLCAPLPNDMRAVLPLALEKAWDGDALCSPHKEDRYEAPYRPLTP